MILGIAATTVGIGVAVDDQHKQLKSHDFNAYIRTNVVAAVINYVRLGYGLVLFADVVGKRTKLTVIIDGKFIEASAGFRSILAAWQKGTEGSITRSCKPYGGCALRADLESPLQPEPALRLHR
jgi:hypothetical protein